jgi:hypothetical protein
MAENRKKTAVVHTETRIVEKLKEPEQKELAIEKKEDVKYRYTIRFRFKGGFRIEVMREVLCQM